MSSWGTPVVCRNVLHSNNQSMLGIQLNSPGLLKHIPLYEKALGTGISRMISARGGNKRVYQSNPQYTMHIILYHIHSNMNDWGHHALITHINALLGKSYYCSCCDMAFNNINSHCCKVWCNICGCNGCMAEAGSSATMCNTCNTPCHSTNCKEAHKTKGGRQSLSMCDSMLFCPSCQVKGAITKRGGGDWTDTLAVNVTVSAASSHTILKRTGTCATCSLFMQPNLNERHRINLSFMISRACSSVMAHAGLI